MQRVLVIGSPGAGKSTFAARLAGRTGLPLIHLDQHYWQPGWIETDKASWEEKVRRLIAADRWVMDGNYGGTLPLRLQRADTVIDLQLPAWLCVARVVRRALAQFGRTRADMTPGCPERLDLSFFAYTARFPSETRPRIDPLKAGFTAPWIALKSNSEVRQFLASLDERG
jgi:adenylate kinase family enzyme